MSAKYWCCATDFGHHEPSCRNYKACPKCDCVEQSDCLDCRYRTLATDILNEAHIPAIEPDITILADDLTKVHYEPRIDGAYASNRTVRELFLSRIGGIGALSRYMLCIRPKGKR